jgi:hypothetical protein
MAAEGVYVEVRTSSPNVRIDRVVGGQTVPVCRAPCRQVLSRNNVYVIQGDGVRSTAQFMLPDDRQQLLLDVEPGSSTRMGGGVVLLALGGLGAYIGYAALIVGTEPQNNSNNNLTEDDRRTARTAGTIFLLSGLAVLGIGAYFVATAHTTVTTSSGVTFSKAPAPAPARKRPAIAFTPRGLEF